MAIGTVLLVVTTIAALLLATALFAKGPGPAWMWRGGKDDPIRNILFRPDGSWRRYGRVGLGVAIVLLLAIGSIGLS